MSGEYRRTFIRDTLKRIAVTAILIGLCIVVSMLPFQNKDLAYTINFVVDFMVGMLLAIIWLDWWGTWF